MRRSRLRRIVAATVAVLIVGAGCQRRAAERDNLVIISLDTLVPDRMSLYGGPRDTTPAIDALAAQAVRFDQAYSPAPWTLPAHAAMLSGLYPSSIVPDPNSLWLLKKAPLLSDRLRARGYRTGAVTGGGYVGAGFGMKTRFDSFQECGKAMNQHTCTSAAIDWLSEVGDEPFFLFFHTFVVHEPYLDRRYVGGLDGGRYADVYRGASPLTDVERVCCVDADPSPQEREFLLALYDGGVAAADELVGEITGVLEKRGLMQNTIIVITSDHGQEFWQHANRGGHGHTLYDELLRVPLLWYDPRNPEGGTSVSTMVGLIDIVPTLERRLELPAERTLDGVDLQPLLLGKPLASKRVLFAEAVKYGPARTSVRTADGKLIVTPRPDDQRNIDKKSPVPVRAPWEFYLPSDRFEENDLADDPRHRKSVKRLMELMRSRRPADPGEPAPESAFDLSPELRDQLRDLGYVD